jgi:MFS family permease
MMKLEVMSKSPELAALLESKEAHVRLLSGTWSAINSTQRLVYAGIALGCIGLAIAYLWKNDLRMPWPPYVYLSCSIFLFALVAIIEWPKTSKWLEEKIRILPHCGIFRKVLHFIRAPAWIALSVGIIGLGHPYYQPENQVLSQAPYSLSILTAGAIAIGMGWGKTKIERLFHYQRVRELFLIVASVHQVREKDRIAAAEATTHTLRSLP